VAAIGEAVGVQAIAITICDEDFEEWILPADRSDVKEGMSIRVQAGAAEAPSSEEEVIAAAQSLRSGSTEEREAVYVTIESAVKQQAIALVVACVKPLIDSVLCAPASRVGVVEWRRASLLLYEMSKHHFAVSAEMHRKNDEGKLHIHTIWTAPGTIFAEMIAKEPGAWDRDDAITAAASTAVHVATWAVGVTAVVAEAGVDEIRD
jgi:hypothetical protein